MPKTKQTAKKSTGGSAKRKLIGHPVQSLSAQCSHTHQASHTQSPTANADMAEEPTVSGIPLVANSGGQLASLVETCNGDDTDHVSCPFHQLLPKSPLEHFNSGATFVLMGANYLSLATHVAVSLASNVFLGSALFQSWGWMNTHSGASGAQKKEPSFM